MIELAVLHREIETLSPIQQEKVYSFVYQLKHTDLKHSDRALSTKRVEPFANEREALDFANDCALRLLHEAR
ncbi:hypothetical protein AGMMS50229_14720 [Campylobacterota bacterium]|nr:hypothetical protein AGMMS50229_14720 [Campylobacterota bacterium]